MKRDLPSFPMPAALRAQARTWPVALAALGAVFAWIGAWYASTVAIMVSIWANSETFAHGFVVLPIVLWLVWRLRDRLAMLSPRPDWRAWPLVALAGCAWLAGSFGEVNAMSQAALIAMLVLAVPAVLGREVARTLLFPLAFMFFCVPVGDFLLPTLMDRTADFTVTALRGSGVPVYREGLQLVIPTGRWSIVEACSGVRYLIASTMVGTLFAYLNYSSPWRRVAFVGVAIVVPIIANWFRAYLIVLLGHLTNNRLAVGVDHIVYGWVFFGLVMVLMFWVGSKWQEAPAEGPPPRNAEAGRAQSAEAWPARFAMAALAIAALTVVWPLVDNRVDARSSSTKARLDAPSIPGWSAAPGSRALFEPLFASPSAIVHERYAREASPVGLYIAYYRDQDFRRKLVSSENRLVASLDPVWNRIGVEHTDAVIDGLPRSVAVTQLRSLDAGSLVVAWQWYWIDGAITSNDAVAKAMIAWSRLRGRGDDAAAIVVYAKAETVQGAQAQLQAFARDAWPSIAAALAAARERR